MARCCDRVTRRGEIVSTFEEQLRGGTRNLNRNLDLTIGVGSDWSAYLNHVVHVDRVGGGLGVYNPSAALAIIGILQNEPLAGDTALVRYGGISRAIIGATVVADDFLKVDAGTSRLVPWVAGTDGHTHAANHAELESVLVRVVDLTGAPVTGLTDHEITVRQWYRAGGVISEHAASTSVVEDGNADGWYEVGVTEIQLVGYPHRLSIEPNDAGHIATPSEYPWTPRSDTSGPPTLDAIGLVVGVALEGGADGDEIMVRILPQLF